MASEQSDPSSTTAAGAAAPDIDTTAGERQRQTPQPDDDPPFVRGDEEEEASGTMSGQRETPSRHSGSGTGSEHGAEAADDIFETHEDILTGFVRENIQAVASMGSDLCQKLFDWLLDADEVEIAEDVKHLDQEGLSRLAEQLPILLPRHDDESLATGHLQDMLVRRTANDSNYVKTFLRKTGASPTTTIGGSNMGAYFRRPDQNVADADRLEQLKKEGLDASADPWTRLSAQYSAGRTSVIVHNRTSDAITKGGHAEQVAQLRTALKESYNKLKETKAREAKRKRQKAAPENLETILDELEGNVDAIAAELPQDLDDEENEDEEITADLEDMDFDDETDNDTDTVREQLGDIPPPQPLPDSFRDESQELAKQIAQRRFDSRRDTLQSAQQRTAITAPQAEQLAASTAKDSYRFKNQLLPATAQAATGPSTRGSEEILIMMVICRYSKPRHPLWVTIGHILNQLTALDYLLQRRKEEIRDPGLRRQPRPVQFHSIVLNGVKATEGFPVALQYQMNVSRISLLAATDAIYNTQQGPRPHLHMIFRGVVGCSARTHWVDDFLLAWPNWDPQIIIAHKWRFLRDHDIVQRINQGLVAISPLQGWVSRRSRPGQFYFSDHYSMRMLQQVGHGNAVDARYQELLRWWREAEQARNGVLPYPVAQAVIDRDNGRNGFP